MSHKFEQLEVWQLAVEYVDLIYSLTEQLPRAEEHNLKSQITRAATSIALNIAEGSTSQTDPEQARFLSLAIRSLIETVACQHLIKRRSYLADNLAFVSSISAQSEAIRQATILSRLAHVGHKGGA